MLRLNRGWVPALPEQAGSDHQPRRLEMERTAPAVLVRQYVTVAGMYDRARRWNRDREQRPHIHIAGLSPIEPRVRDENFDSGNNQGQESQRGEPVRNANQERMPPKNLSRHSRKRTSAYGVARRLPEVRRFDAGFRASEGVWISRDRKWWVSERARRVFELTLGRPRPDGGRRLAVGTVVRVVDAGIQAPKSSSEAGSPGGARARAMGTQSEVRPRWSRMCAVIRGSVMNASTRS